MAKSRRRARKEAPQTPAEPKEHKRQAAIWLATLSTVVGIATGMFTLRDQVFPRESGSAQAVSVSAYQQQVGGVCDDVNSDDSRRARQIKTIHKQLVRAKTTTAQRNALLDGQRQTIARSGDALASFAALEPPKAAAGDRSRGEGGVEAQPHPPPRLRERLDRAGTRPQLEASVQLPRDAAHSARPRRRRADGRAAAPRRRQLRPADADQQQDVPAPAAEEDGAREPQRRIRKRRGKRRLRRALGSPATPPRARPGRQAPRLPRATRAPARGGLTGGGAMSERQEPAGGTGGTENPSGTGTGGSTGGGRLPAAAAEAASGRPRRPCDEAGHRSSAYG